MLLALAICIFSFKLSLYARRGPGAGFMGFGTGGILFLLSLHLFLKNLFFPNRETLEGPILKNKKINVSILSALIFYALFLERLGYILDLFLVLLFLFAISKTMKWYAIIGTSILISLGSYLLFSTFLNIGLPLGVLKVLR